MRPIFRQSLFALGLAGLAFAGAPLSADPVPVDAKTVVTAPDWVVGSTWYYSDGYALKVTSVTSGSTVFDRLDAPGQWFSRQGFLRKDLTSGTATRTSIFRTIPDQAGMSLRAGSPLTFQREYLENGTLMVQASSWSVEGRETITVPAGTFDCWVIVFRSRSLRSDWTGFERWWYSPQAQNYVRLEYKYGPDAEGSRVLMRYQLGAQTAQLPAPTPAPASASPPAPVAPAPAPATTEKTATAAPAAAIITAEAARPASITLAPVTPDKTAMAAPAAASNAPAPVTPAPITRDPVTADKTAAAVTPAGGANVSVANALPAVPPLPPARQAENRTEVAAARPTVAETNSTGAGGRRLASNGGVWHAQIASSKNEAAIRRTLDKTVRDHADLLKDLPSGVATAQIGDRGIFHRAWLGEFDHSGGAVALCNNLRADGEPCAILKSGRGAGQKMASSL